MSIRNSFYFTAVQDAIMLSHPFVHSIGHETYFREDHYYWDCRSNMESICILQYTVSGEGRLQAGDKIYKQNAGDAFLIERPGDYQYWKPDDSDRWEICFISFSISCLPFIQAIVHSFGNTFKLENDCEPLQKWQQIYSLTRDDHVRDFFCSSSLAFNFILSLHQHLRVRQAAASSHTAIRDCMEFISQSLDKPVSLTDIANAGNISPFYLNKKFKQIYGETPINYLVKQRIRKSIHLLWETQDTISSISKQCGFSDANYFSKTFRKYTGISPTEYRASERPAKPIILY